MQTECCRIFVLERSLIEEIIDCVDKKKIFIETSYFSHGAYIRASSECGSSLDVFFSQLRERAGLFFLKDTSVSDYSRTAEETAGRLLEERKKSVAAAESCTGGLISKKLTDRQGSSAYFWGSFVTYNNNAKILLGVKQETLAEYGAVSAETVHEMAECARLKSESDISVSVSGIAGPGGGSTEKPVGTVWFGICDAGKAEEVRVLFRGSREEIREKASETALLLIIKKILKGTGVDSIICGDYI